MLTQVTDTYIYIWIFHITYLADDTHQWYCMSNIEVMWRTCICDDKNIKNDEITGEIFINLYSSVTYIGVTCDFVMTT